jgi:hypothetical protein
MPYWDDGSNQSKSQYDSGGGYDNKGNQNNNPPQTVTQKAPPKKPKVTKENKVDQGFIKNYLQYHPVYSTLNKLSKSKFATNLNAKRRQKYLENLKEEDINAYNQIVGDLEKVNYVKRGVEFYGPESKGAGRDIEKFTDLGEEQALEILGQRYKDTLPTFNNNNRGDNQQPFIPINYNTGAATIEDVEPYNQFTYDENAFGPGGDARDVTDPRGYNFNQGGRARRAEGGIMELRARRAFGGIMDRVTGRKAYGLGSIFKSVKNAASKVLSSDIGKMAIMGAGIYYGGGGANMFKSGASNSGGWMGGLKAMGGNFFSKANPLLFSNGELSLGKLAGVSAALPFLMPKAKPNETSFSDRGGSLIDPITGQPAKPAEMRASLNNALDNANGDPIRIKQINDAYAFLGPDERLGTYSPYRTYGVKDGGRIGRAEGGLMDLGGMEKDYRAEGGFVPIGAKEKADDVPARLSVNEFVFTADAVRGAGGGDIDKGAEIMENMMVNLEKGGTISEESQGNIGAQQMFETSERLGEVI